jgi:type II restriction/modification system DNA methylase subunit YeeA
LPFPDSEDSTRDAIINLVDQILTAKRTQPNADVSNLENEIDQIVYLLYDLTADEIAIVEEKE